MLALVGVKRMENYVAISRPAQRIGFDEPARTLIVQSNAEAVGGREPDNFKIRLGDGPERQTQRALTYDFLPLRDLIGSGNLWCFSAFEPGEESREFAPECLNGRQCRQLVGKHRSPARFQVGLESLKVSENRYRDFLERAFLSKNIVK